MGSYSFQVWWVVSGIVLLVLAFVIGLVARLGILGILIDGRGRYSLTHFQIVLWTVVILSSLLGLLVSKHFDPAAIQLPPELLRLMGISAGSAVLASAAKAAADASRPENIARKGKFNPSMLPEDERVITANFSQIWLEEEGKLADKVVNITKFQNFIFTLVILGIYITMAWKQAGIPKLPDNIVWLIGISHAGYVGGKIPAKK